MRSLRFAAALVVATLLHVARRTPVPGLLIRHRPVLADRGLQCLDGNTLAGMLGGLVAGLVTDALTGGPFGIHGLADTIIGYGTAYAVQRLVIQRVTESLSTVRTGRGDAAGAVDGVSLLVLPSPEAPRIMWLMVRIVSSGILGSGPLSGRQAAALHGGGMAGGRGRRKSASTNRHWNVKRVREHRDALLRRLPALQIAVAAAMVVVVGSYWFVQVVQGDYYRELAENNRLKEIPVEAARGLIFDRESRLLVENVPSYNLLLEVNRSHDVAQEPGVCCRNPRPAGERAGGRSRA